MKLMGVQVDQNTKTGFIAGMVGGIYQWSLNINLPTDFLSKLVEGGITAIVCGFVGMAGKELYQVTQKAFKAYFKGRRKRKPRT